MKIIKVGHIYLLDEVPTNNPKGSTITIQELYKNLGPDSQFIRFVNNEGPDYYHGTQTQEILRVLIDRTMHCDNCLRWPNNDAIIFHLRMALILHEARALERKAVKGLIKPERIITANDGHYDLNYSLIHSYDAIEYDKRREEE